jgi:PmbA protein
MKLAEQEGLSIRVIKDNRLGFSYSSDLSDSALDQLVTQAIANAENTGEDKFSDTAGYL